MLLLTEYCYTVNMIVFDVLLLIILPTTCLIASMDVQVKCSHQWNLVTQLVKGIKSNTCIS